MYSLRVKKGPLKGFKQFFFKNSPVDWSGCSRLLREKRVQGRPLMVAPRRLPDRPRKASAFRGNQRSILQTLKKNVSASFLQSIEDFI